MKPSDPIPVLDPARGKGWYPALKCTEGGPHHMAMEGGACVDCRKPMPKALIERLHPMREPVRAVAGAVAYGRTVEKASAFDARQRAAGEREE
jgi:hypothetical protein